MRSRRGSAQAREPLAIVDVGDDEIARLAMQLQRLSSRCDAQVAQLANVAHDLRTPLASMQGLS
jgi:signal transduction histidine kinase